MITSSNIKECGDLNNSLITFAWDVTTQCQYRCSYCYAHDILTSKFDVKLHNIYALVLKRLKLIKSHDFCIELLGGEPTLHPHFYKIVDGCFSLDHCKNVMIVTNLARPITYYKDFNNEKFKGLQFDVSFHPEHVKNINEWCKKLKQLNEYEYLDVMANINLVDDEKFIDSYIKIIEYCIENKIEISLNVLFSTKKYVSKYSDNFLKFFERYKDNLLNSSQSNLIKFVDYNNNIEYYTSMDIHRYKLNRYKGFNCRPKIWKINANGQIVNVCTQKPLEMSGINANECVSCPLESCNIEAAHEFHKTAPNQTQPIK